MAVNVEALIHTANQMSEFRKQGYHDVTIYVEGKPFPCHRHLVAAACPTLRPMLLEQNWQTAEEPHLSNIEPQLFEIIIEFVYSGVLGITTDNGFSLLKTADYLCMDHVVKSCTTFLKASCPLEDFVEAFEFAIYLRDFDFIDIMAAKIFRSLDKWCMERRLLPLSFENFLIILKKSKLMIDHEGSKYLWCCNTNYPGRYVEGTCAICKEPLKGPVLSHRTTISSLVFDWIKYDVRRMDHFQVVAEYGDLRKSQIRDIISLVQCYRDDLMKRVEDISTPNKIFAHVLVDNKVKTLSTIDKMEEWILSSSFTCSVTNFKTVEKNRKVFYLSYTATENENSFWTENEMEMDSLRAPPTVVSTYKLASAKDLIYLYDSSDKTTSPEEPKKRRTDITNIYSYVEGKDQWFSEPCSCKKFYHSYFVTLKNSLYLIGGTSEYEFPYPSQKYVQQYDPRTAKWNVISRDSEVDLILNGSACAYDDQIYIYSKPEFDDKVNNLKFFTFDTRVNKWEVVDHKLEQDFQPMALVALENQLWAFPQNPKQGYMIYDLSRNAWSERKKLLGEFHSIEDCKIVDVNIFEKF